MDRPGRDRGVDLAGLQNAEETLASRHAGEGKSRLKNQLLRLQSTKIEQTASNVSFPETGQSRFPRIVGQSGTLKRKFRSFYSKRQRPVHKKGRLKDEPFEGSKQEFNRICPRKKQ